MNEETENTNKLLLRQRAEELLKTKKSNSNSNKILSNVDMLKLVHEFEVHQIELEMINEELLFAKEKIEASEIKYNAITNQSTEGITITNMVGNYIFVNPAFCKMTGYSETELLKMSAFDLKSKSQEYTTFFDNKEKNTGLTIEVKLIRKDKTEFFSEIIGKIIKYDNQNFLLGTIRDITERKLIELKLKANQKLLAETQQVGKVGGWEFNIDTLKQTWTQETYIIHEVNFNHEPNVENGINFYSTTSKPIIENAVNCAITNGEPFDLELEIITAKNNLRNVHVIGKADLINHRIYGFFQDITDRKEAEKSLKESEAKLRISDTDFKVSQKIAHIGNWKWDLKTSEVTWSDEMFHIFGIDKNSYTGRLGDVISKIPDDLQVVLPSDSPPIAKKKPKEYQILLPDKSIKYIWSETGETTFDDNGIPLFINGIAQDITERKQAERALKESEQKINQQNSELSKLNADKDRFISILAHDLKSPFNLLLGFSDLLLANIHKYDIDKINNQVKIIQNISQQTFNLLEDVLLWIKSSSQKLPFEPQKINFTEICNQVINILINYAEAKKITINCFETENNILFADLNMFKTILQNLISNAIKFTNQNGQINIYSEKDDKNITIIVSDNGLGIEQENIPKLWDFSKPFTTTGTADEKGTGFGLLVCKEFVEKHNGHIWVESELEKGSDFKFTVPLYNHI